MCILGGGELKEDIELFQRKWVPRFILYQQESKQNSVDQKSQQHMYIQPEMSACEQHCYKFLQLGTQQEVGLRAFTLVKSVIGASFYFI